jgi:hypothetical protein
MKPQTMKTKQLLPVALAAMLWPAVLPAAETNKWSCDISLYGLAAGMSGDVTVRGVPADVDLGFDQIWDNLEFGAMGTVRIGYGRWALNADVIYMGLQASKNGVSLDFEQWMVEPSLSFRILRNVELLAGARYNNLSGDVTGPLGRNPSGTQEWWDPIVGGKLSLPLGEKFSLNFRGDVGGFGVSSDLTWQAYPSVRWQVSRGCSIDAGYRWVYTDYTTGSGGAEFKYDMLTQGPQLGVTFHF